MVPGEIKSIKNLTGVTALQDGAQARNRCRRSARRRLSIFVIREYRPRHVASVLPRLTHSL